MQPNLAVREANDQVAREWLKLLATFDLEVDSPRSQVEEIVSQHYNGKTCQVKRRIDEGAFNYCFQLQLEDGEQVILRFPIPGYSKRPLRKIEDELATMHFLKTNTDIPIPTIIAHGEAKDKFSGLGYYIIMEFIDGYRLDRLILDNEGRMREGIPEKVTHKLYKQIAHFLLQLTRHPFDKIGALSMSSEVDPVLSVSRGPLTMKSNEIERLSRVNCDDLMQEPYTSVPAYYGALLEQSSRYLQNDPTVGSVEEACGDYKALHALKLKSAAFTAEDETNGPFLLFNDDLRYGNMIVDQDYNIIALLDWEFCYAAPPSFIKSPPHWLIGLEPFEWQADNLQEFSTQLDIFLQILEKEEDIEGLNNNLSNCMRKYFRDGTFWYNFASREFGPLNRVMEYCWNYIGEVCPPDDLEEFLKHKTVYRELRRSSEQEQSR